MKSYFITGTDTDCGKTYVTCALIRHLQSHQKSVMALKPVASGCEQIDQKLISGDVSRLKASQGDDSTEICPWMFPLSVSPHLAAKASGTTLDVQEIVTFCQDTAWQTYDYLLIEGAGGLMVPLNDQQTWIDVLRELNIPVVLVVGMTLGCINHALLTITALKHYRIPCAGWIANCLDPEMLCLNENIETLQKLIPFPLMARLERNGELIPINFC